MYISTQKINDLHVKHGVKTIGIIQFEKDTIFIPSGWYKISE